MMVVVGSLNMDLVVRVERLPLPGETVLGEDYQTYPGGKGANQAVAAARLGARVRMVGRIGQDSFGRTLLASLAAEGVDVEGVAAVPGPTGVAFILVDAKGQNAIAVAPGANARFGPEDLAEKDFETVQLLVVQLEIPWPTVARAMARARARGARVLLNAAPARLLPEEAWRLADVLVVNEPEAATLTQRDPPAGPSEALDVARALARRRRVLSYEEPDAPIHPAKQAA
ncbi:MAG: ribokinase, partial [candidate division GAL15 bacterium]